MKEPWEVFLHELNREIDRAHRKGERFSKESLQMVLGDAFGYHMIDTLGWRPERMKRLRSDFIDVILEHDREDWGRELEKVWRRWQQ